MKLKFFNKLNKSPSSIQTDIHDTIEDLKEVKNAVIAYSIFSVLFSVFLSGFLIQYITHIFNARKKIILMKCFSIGLTNTLGLILTIIFIATMLIGGLRVFKQFHHNYETDPDGDHQVSKSGVYGRAHWQREEERQECFIRDTDPYNIKGDVLGIDENGLLYSINPDIKGLNKNVAIMGASGAGKSEAMVKPMIYQNIIRGDSMIITDSKGDLYKDTCEIAIKHGYTMRVLNLKSSEIKNSDGVDLLKILKESEDCDAKAEVLANIIIENSGDGHMDYFAINEMNLLKAILLLVTTNEDYIRAGKDNLAEVYNICSHNTPDSLAAMFNMLDEEDPAYEAFTIYNQCEPKVKGQILNGMAIRLNKLSNKNLKEVVKNDEIDMLLPMKKRCIYYVVISDMDRAYKFIATLFFSELFIKLSEYADGMTTEERKNRIHVNFILDEYANTGAIPDMDQKVSTIRSRDITTTIILQDIGQLEHMYPDLWETILNNMSIKILLATNDDKTAEWFSKKLGTKTVRVVNRMFEKNAGDMIEAPGGWRQSEGLGKRLLMSPDELQNELSENDLVIIISKRFPIKLKKYLAFQHPMDKEKEGKVRIAKKHLPKWRKKILDKQKEARQKELEEKLAEEKRLAAEEQAKIAEKKRLEIERKEREAEEREIEAAIREREEREKKMQAEEKASSANTKTYEVPVPDFIELEEDDIPDIEVPDIDIDEEDIPEIESPDEETYEKENAEIDDKSVSEKKKVSQEPEIEKTESKGWASKWATDIEDDDNEEEEKENIKKESERPLKEKTVNAGKGVQNKKQKNTNTYDVISDTSSFRKNDKKKEQKKEEQRMEKDKQAIESRNNKSDNAVSGLFS